jgi:hypothetical protein
MFFRPKRAVPYEKRQNLPVFSAFFRLFLSVGMVCGSAMAAWPLRGGMDIAEMKKAANS